jgi:YihY family inner membrane protein
MLENAINTKLDELVQNEEFMAKVKGISGDVYDFFIEGAKELKVIAAQDVVSDVVDALVEVDPQFAPLQEQVNTWQGLELEPMEDAPDFKAIKNSLAVIFWVSLGLSIVLGALYLRWARSPKGGLLFVGIPLLVLGAMNVIAASSVMIIGSFWITELKETNLFTNGFVIFLFNTLKFFILLAVFYLTSAFIFRFAPAIHDKWHFFSTGAQLAGFLITLSFYGFIFYLENFASYNKLYGSIGTIIALMLWLYLTSVIVLVCFEVNVSFDLAEEKQRARGNLKKLLAKPSGKE